MATDKKNTKTKTSGSSPDPFLRSFLQQAVAIIASEKGLTDASHAKLQKIADQLGLSQQVFHNAIQQLKAPDSSLGLNHYEKKFAELIDAEFKKFTGDVLSIRFEKRLANLAETKYQIPPVRAHQLIQKTAEQNSVGIISQTDARQLVEHLVEDSVGKRLKLPESDVNNLIDIGEKWGIEATKVNQQIVRLTAQNRRLHQIAKVKRFTAYAITTGGIILFSLLLRQIDWAWFSPETGSELNVSNTNGENDLAAPAWWNTAMTNAFKNGTTPERQKMLATISKVGESESQTIANAQKLAEFALNQRQQSPLDDFITNMFIESPDDDCAAAIARKLQSNLNVAIGESTINARTIRQSKNAARLVTEIIYGTPKNLNLSRQSDFYGTLQNLTGEIADYQDKQDFLNNLLSHIAFRFWSTAVINSYSSPRTVAGSLKDLEQLPTNQPLETNELRIRTCIGILRNEPNQWTTILPSIEKSISSSNRANLKIWQRIANSDQYPQDIRTDVNQLITQHLKPDSQKANSLKPANSISSNHTNAPKALANNADSKLKYRQLIDTKIQLLQQRLRILGINAANDAEKTDSTQIPEITLQVAEINTEIIGWVEQKTDFEKLSTTVSNYEKLKFSNFPQPVAATPSQRRQFKESLEKLNDRQIDGAAGRIRAINRIRELVSKIPRLDQSSSAIMAGHLLSPPTQQEQLANERAMQDLGRWPRLLLAMMDQIDKSNLTANDQNELFLRAGIDSLRNDKMKEQASSRLQSAVLAHCQELLNERIQRSPQYLMWAAMDGHYRKIYLQRLSYVQEAKDNARDNWTRNLQIAAADFDTRLARHAKSLDSQSNRLGQWSQANYILAALIERKHRTRQFRTTNLEHRDPTFGSHLLASELHLFEVLKSVYQQSKTIRFNGGSQ